MLISYYFPPTASVGALRWEKMARLLYERGWAVDAITVAPEASARISENVDAARLAGLPPDTRVYTVAHPPLALWDRPTKAYHKLRDLARQVRGGRSTGGPSDKVAGIASPGQHADRRGVGRRTFLAVTLNLWYRQWRNAASTLAARVLTPEHRVVVTSGPPHVAHEVGLDAATRAGLPLVIDLRDPWSRNAELHSDIGNRRSPLSAWAARRAEQQVVPAAALVVCNTDALRDEMITLYPRVTDRTLTVMNGVDDEPLPPPSYAQRFTIAFAGSIYIDRDPTVLFRGLRVAVERLGLAPDAIGVELMGQVETYAGGSVRALAEREGVSAFVTLHPPRPRAQALAFQAGAQMLATLPQDSLTQIPAKTFEYTAFPAWLLVHTPPTSATATLLRETGADVVGIDDVERTAAVIEARYRQWRGGERPTALNAGGRFSRRAQATPLLDRLAQLADARSFAPIRRHAGS